MLQFSEINPLPPRAECWALKIGDSFDYRPPRGIQSRILFEKPLWFALRTPPQQERHARDFLRKRGVPSFFPDQNVTVKRLGKVRTQRRPMVTGYVFARFEGQPHWDILFARKFFVGVVTLDGVPWEFARKDILQMLNMRVRAEERRAALRAYQEAQQAARMPVPGQPAKMVEGPLAGFCVDVQEVSAGIAYYLLPGNVKGSAPVGKLERDA